MGIEQKIKRQVLRVPFDLDLKDLKMKENKRQTLICRNPQPRVFWFH